MAEARRLSQRFEVHYTPKHGSPAQVLAEIERIAHWIANACRNAWPPLSKLNNRWLPGPLGVIEPQVTITWRFTAQDASIKLKHLYPSISD